MGRDKFFTLLRNNDLLVQRKKNFTRTTYSNHTYRFYKNQIKDLQITRKNQVWVSDITYIRTLEGFRYLSLITDLYSRKIVYLIYTQGLIAIFSIKHMKSLGNQ